jgi:spore germination protein YaaH
MDQPCVDRGIGMQRTGGHYNGHIQAIPKFAQFKPRPQKADQRAYTSLEANFNKLDMIVSEGFFIMPGRDTMVANIDTGLINLNRKYRKPVLISLSNYVNYDKSNGGYDLADVERIIKNKKLRTQFINNLATQLTRFKFKGINLDFDNIKNINSTEYIAFENDLYAILHPQGLLVTMNVIPDDDTYNLERKGNSDGCGRRLRLAGKQRRQANRLSAGY